MKVLITGAAGFLGSHLCDYFLGCGHSVIGLDNFVTGNLDNLAMASKNSNFSFRELDLINGLPSSLPAVDAVLHFACPASPKDYFKYPEETLKVDSIGTFHVLEKSSRDNAKFIMASTSEVYGDPEIHPQPETYWGNVNPVGVRSVYDEAKRFSEAATMAFYRNRKLDVRIARIFNTYGPRMQVNDGRVVPNFISQSLNGEKITVYGDGLQTRSFCFVDDLVRGIYKYTTIEDPKYRIVNLGNPDEYQILQFAKIIVSLLGDGSEIKFEPLPLDDPKQRKPDISLAKEMLEWEPNISLSEGLLRTIDYFRKQIKNTL
ncbi:UDP-glucuronic acid decarboxylase family protein [Ferroacidibacillus organovorans]|uniref:NAD-dependent dehydratase n=1 Tax=Ferroacidibacillus organovorans TaxID=1765683 RepID=A0A853KDF4_9BACL|nr:UDP-glucuronic acid decarboxylase family protein [Ferroacidibacillus organovorans]KYP79583.1 NAD-dependent dehydratase [Ferroacidibacillus organovorans]OAG93440.1 NAD-dependent dehydratase [Ferroacidibacillus organovorans]